MTTTAKVVKLAETAKGIARDVDAVAGSNPGVGSLATAVEVLAEAIRLLAERLDAK